MKNSRIAFLLALGLFLMTTAVFAGCGKKADPMFPGVKPAPTLAGVQLERGSESVIVRWPVRGSQQNMSLYRLEKSGMDMKGNDCPGCPRQFDTIAEVDVDDPACREEGGQRCRYTDDNVIAGYHYIYRLFSCDGAGRCEPVFAPADINF